MMLGAAGLVMCPQQGRKVHLKIVGILLMTSCTIGTTSTPKTSTIAGLPLPWTWAFAVRSLLLLV